ncbi:hypothetical protein H1P_1530008 [Hyella patelloides LEGE 07179]|uniref:Uncharacterized protein n=1 Tax=Hyella patelloides LEGE 07179 TaxID=945734 RepID=A0A563VM76_9CYAN|nr:hypothetical protein H1P_1530008 [Hyella patelloides LEGE 07179]
MDSQKLIFGNRYFVPQPPWFLAQTFGILFYLLLNFIPQFLDCSVFIFADHHIKY